MVKRRKKDFGIVLMIFMVERHFFTSPLQPEVFYNHSDRHQPMLLTHATIEFLCTESFFPA